MSVLTLHTPWHGVALPRCALPPILPCLHETARAFPAPAQNPQLAGHRLRGAHPEREVGHQAAEALCRGGEWVRGTRHAKWRCVGERVCAAPVVSPVCLTADFDWLTCRRVVTDRLIYNPTYPTHLWSDTIFI